MDIVERPGNGRKRDLEALVTALTRARLDGETLPRPGFDLTLEEAYAVQERVNRAIGGAPVGWKIGSTSKEAQARLGTDEPGAGRLLARFSYPDGARIPVYSAHHVCVEVEFAFRMAAALPVRAEPYREDEVRAGIGAFVPAMEIVGSRFSAGLAASGRSLVTADGGANVAFVAGPECALPEGFDLAAHPCRLEHNGALAAVGEGARALGDPIRVLAWLATHLSARGLGLEAGAVVTTGTCTGLVPVEPGDRLGADFGTLGRVEATLTGPDRTGAPKDDFSDYTRRRTAE